MRPSLVAALLLVGQGLLPLPALAQDGAGQPSAAGEEMEIRDADRETPVSRPPARHLAGTPWKQLPSISPAQTKIQDVHYLMFKDGGELTAVGECAHFWGKYRLGGDGSILITNFRARRQDCSNAAGGDQRFITALVMANTFRIEGTELSLYQESRRLMSFGAVSEMPAVERPERRRAAKPRKEISANIKKTRAKARGKKERK